MILNVVGKVGLSRAIWKRLPTITKTRQQGKVVGGELRVEEIGLVADKMYKTDKTDKTDKTKLDLNVSLHF